MKTALLTNSKIISILKENGDGSTMPDLCRKHGMSFASFYKWRSKFGGMGRFTNEADERT